MPRGRPQRSPLEPMRAKAWMAGVMSASGATSAYQVAKLFNAGLAKRFEKYARGTVSPTITTLNLVEQKFPNTRRVYDEGPANRVPLWKAMDGPVEAAWECLVLYDPEFESMRQVGASHEAKVRIFMEKLKLGPVEADLLAWQKNFEANVLPRQIDQSTSIQQGIGLDEFAALIALWRVSMFIGIETAFMLYLLDGVCRSVVTPKLLDPWGIKPAELVDFLNGHVRRNQDQFSHLLPQRSMPVEPRGW